MGTRVITIFLVSFLFSPHSRAESSTPASHVLEREARAERQRQGGLLFSCGPQAARGLAQELRAFLKSNEIEDKVKIEQSPATGAISVRLEMPSVGTNTLDLKKHKELKLEDVKAKYKDDRGNERSVTVVSKKEILVSLLVPGRSHVFEGDACSIKALKDYIGTRQNISLWASVARWEFPEGRAAYADRKFWDSEFCVRRAVTVCQALSDAFPGRDYELGCMTACKMIMAQGIFDYYNRKKEDSATTAELERLVGNDPLSGMAPKTTGADRRQIVQAGKLLDRHFDVPWNNWVAGDWGYIKNLDRKSSEVQGQEGSNIIYIGGGEFATYYGREQNRSLDESVARVYGWGHSSHPSRALMSRLHEDPRNGGYLRDVRDVPKVFGKAATNDSVAAVIPRPPVPGASLPNPFPPEFPSLPNVFPPEFPPSATSQHAAAATSTAECSAVMMKDREAEIEKRQHPDGRRYKVSYHLCFERTAPDSYDAKLYTVSRPFGWRGKTEIEFNAMFTYQRVAAPGYSYYKGISLKIRDENHPLVHDMVENRDLFFGQDRSKNEGEIYFPASDRSRWVPLLKWNYDLVLDKKEKKLKFADGGTINLDADDIAKLDQQLDATETRVRETRESVMADIRQTVGEMRQTMGQINEIVERRYGNQNQGTYRRSPVMEQVYRNLEELERRQRSRFPAPGPF